MNDLDKLKPQLIKHIKEVCQEMYDTSKAIVNKNPTEAMKYDTVEDFLISLLKFTKDKRIKSQD